jgi:hypothetical protein
VTPLLDEIPEVANLHLIGVRKASWAGPHIHLLHCLIRPWPWLVARDGLHVTKHACPGVPDVCTNPEKVEGTPPVRGNFVRSLVQGTAVAPVSRAIATEVAVLNHDLSVGRVQKLSPKCHVAEDSARIDIDAIKSKICDSLHIPLVMLESIVRPPPAIADRRLSVGGVVRICAHLPRSRFGPLASHGLVGQVVGICLTQGRTPLPREVAGRPRFPPAWDEEGAIFSAVAVVDVYDTFGSTESEWRSKEQELRTHTSPS